MKKCKMFVMFTMLLLLTMLFMGCGQTQEEKIAEVQEANTITTADVVELLEYHDLTVEKQTPSDAWMEQWPDVEIYKINGEGLLLIQATEGLHLYQRDKLVQELDWNFWGYRYDSTESILLNQLLTDFAPETGFYAYCFPWEAKNVIACYVPYYNAEYPGDSVTTEEDVDAWMAMMEEALAPAEQVGAVFQEEINGIEVKRSRAEGQHFTLNTQISYFQVPLEVDGNTSYDLYYEMQAYITAHEDTAELFKGQEAKVELKTVKVGSGATHSRSESGTFEELFVNRLDTDVEINDRFIAAPQPQETLEFQVVITVGNYVEAFDITVDIVNSELTLDALGAIEQSHKAMQTVYEYQASPAESYCQKERIAQNIVLS